MRGDTYVPELLTFLHPLSLGSIEAFQFSVIICPSVFSCFPLFLCCGIYITYEACSDSIVVVLLRN